jgi:ABC-type sugar transport system ATPase subunit
MLLELKSITKSFGGVGVLHGVDFSLKAGEIHALLGHNGAGKSTLIKILAGVFAPQGGEILIDGEPVVFADPHASALAGVAVVYQDFSLVPALSVAENIALGRHPRLRVPFAYSKRVTRARSMAEAAALGIDLPMDTKVSELGVARQQLAEIVRALSQNARILVMDEPTARLAPGEREHLFELMRKLAARGVGIIFITHFLEEVPVVADQVTVLRNGAVAVSRPANEFTVNEMARLLVGEEPARLVESAAGSRKDGSILVELRDFSVTDRPPINVQIKAGEVVGVAGLVGAGRTRLARALIGDLPATGTFMLRGQPFRRKGPAGALAEGIAFVPEDRKVSGLVGSSSVRDNMALSAIPGALTCWGFIDRRKRRDLATSLIERFRVRPTDPSKRVDQLSGGNAQKVLLARAAAIKPSFLILDQPTAGVDVGAKAELHSQIQRLANEGTAILLISDDLDEILDVTDRIEVMNAGVITSSLNTATATRSELLEAISRVPGFGSAERTLHAG